jgi:hypothetical protein
VFAAAISFTACNDARPAPDQAQARQYYDAMAEIAREIHNGSLEMQTLTHDVAEAAAQGKAYNKKAVDETLRARLERIRSLRTRVEALRSPTGASAEALQVAMLRGLDGEARRLQGGMREWLDLYGNDAVSLSERQSKGKAIAERVQADRNEDEAAIKSARDAFVKEFRIKR